VSAPTVKHTTRAAAARHVRQVLLREFDGRKGHGGNVQVVYRQHVRQVLLRKNVQVVYRQLDRQELGQLLAAAFFAGDAHARGSEEEVHRADG